MLRVLLSSTLALGFLAACNGDDSDQTGDEKDDELYGPPLLQGDIVVEWRDSLEDQHGQLRIRKAFGFAAAGGGAIYMSSFGEATCDLVVEGLKEGGEFDPAQVFKPGYCNASLAFRYDKDGGLDGTSHTDDPINALWSIECPFGYEDDWVWGKNGHGDDGYWYSGHTWQGDPTNSTISFTGDDVTAFDVNLEFNNYSGSFIYEDLGDFTGVGSAHGSFTVEVCEGLTQTPIWPL